MSKILIIEDEIAIADLEKNKKTKALERALEVEIPEEIFENLRERVNK